jgi:CubicO group peptidase (beta-lactamase class C family)
MPPVVAAVTVLIHVGAAQGAEYPGQRWESITPADAALDPARLTGARDYALTGGGAGIVVRRGRAVIAWGDTKQRFDLKSTTKSFGATALGVAIADGKVKLSDRAIDLHPSFGVPPEENRSTGWLGEITLAHLATQTAGFEKPGGYGRLLFRPGTKWHYSDAGPNWLAECLTLRYRRDLRDVMFEKVFTPLGITADDLTWRDNQYRPHRIDGIPRREFGSGISANVEAMARLGYLYLRGGKWGERQILPRDFVEAAGRPPKELVGLPEYEPQGEQGNASDHYGLLWWNNADGTLPPPVPRDAYWSWGLYDGLIVVVPSLDLVVARAGKSWERKPGAAHYDVLRPFLGPVCSAVVERAGAARPVEAGCRIARIEWAPPETIVRRARGSDNWPMTWADDGEQYTAYGDGWGFEPRVPQKLSLGFARVSGSPQDFVGRNIRSPSGESTGDGPRGRKASGMLMVDGVLYAWVRNAGNSQLGWSTDHAMTWTWADWKFDRRFGCPTFINCGRNYGDAPDGYVYTVSPHADDAYTPADSFDLARVPKDRMRQRDAWEFFAGRGGDGPPRWAKDPAGCAPVLEKPGKCSRSGVTYVPALGRYLWVITLPASGGGPEGRWSGLSVYESPQPWGPWTNVYEADRWDVNPGDSATFPAKWIAPDGRSAHLVVSGGDSFSVRRASFVLAERVDRQSH